MSGSNKIPGGSMTWLMENTLHPGVGISLAEMIVDPGQTSELHRHSNCSEVLYVLEGDILQWIGAEWIKLGAGDRCVIPANSAHQTRNPGPKPAKMILVYSDGQRDYEKMDPATHLHS